MKSVFTAFVVTACLMLAVTAVLGAAVDGAKGFDRHFACGLVATLFLCFAHSAVFTYFMATGKMIKLAVEDAGLEPELFARARACKRRAYRVLMPAIMMALAAAFTGGWVTDRPARATVHLVVVLAAMAAQLVAWWMEYAAIADNGRLMDEVFERHAQQSRDRKGAQ